MHATLFICYAHKALPRSAHAHHKHGTSMGTCTPPCPPLDPSLPREQYETRQFEHPTWHSVLLLLPYQAKKKQPKQKGGDLLQMKATLIFFGTGSSASTPIIRCIMQRDLQHCTVCEAAAADPFCVDARTPPSLLLKHDDTNEAFLIDCGPGFKKNAVRFFPEHNVKAISSVLLTHDHYDALSSLNDLREAQLAALPPDVWTVTARLPVYANPRALETAQRMFPFLFSDESFKTATGKLNQIELTHGTPFVPEGFEGLEVMPLDVEHGEGYMSLAFVFGVQTVVAYVSDVSVIPEKTMKALKDARPHILIIDAIADFARPSHFSVSQALEAIRDIAPRQQAYLVGMGCQLQHTVLNTRLAETKDLPCPVEAAYDGLSLEVVL